MSIPVNYTDPDQVDFVSPEVQTMREDWAIVESLLGGTRAMRLGREVWLPREEGEGLRNYEARLSRTYLFPAYADQIRRLIAKPFSRPVQLMGGDAPDALDELERSTDGTGRSLTATLAGFGFDCFDAVTYGLSHLLIDFPAETGSTGPPLFASRSGSSARALRRRWSNPARVNLERDSGRIPCP